MTMTLTLSLVPNTLRVSGQRSPVFRAVISRLHVTQLLCRLNYTNIAYVFITMFIGHVRFDPACTRQQLHNIYQQSLHLYYYLYYYNY